MFFDSDLNVCYEDYLSNHLTLNVRHHSSVFFWPWAFEQIFQCTWIRMMNKTRDFLVHNQIHLPQCRRQNNLNLFHLSPECTHLQTCELSLKNKF